MKAKRFLSGILAISASVGCMFSMTGCETSRPKVQMEITFQDDTYVLNYTLYRKVAPATVEHFLTLAENHYYDGVVVHDYNTTRMYTGAYAHSDTDDTGLEYKKYFDIVKNYQYFPHTVYAVNGNPTYTLCGEFDDNNIGPESGKKKETFGALTMYYSEKESDVFTVKIDHPEVAEDVEITRDYPYNSATSMFFITIGSTETNNSRYCTFATLDAGSVDTLKDLKKDIADYIDDNGSDAKKKQTVKIDTDDPLFGDTSKPVEYNVLQSPVTIKKVTVKSR